MAHQRKAAAAKDPRQAPTHGRPRHDAPPAAKSPADGVLDLQRLVGNRATRSVLQQQPTASPPGRVQRYYVQNPITGKIRWEDTEPVPGHYEFQIGTFNGDHGIDKLYLDSSAVDEHQARQKEQREQQEAAATIRNWARIVTRGKYISNDREYGVAVLYELSSRLEFCLDAEGAYGQLWLWKKTNKLFNSAWDFYGSLKKLITKVMNGEAASLSVAEVRKIQRQVAIFDSFIVELNRRNAQLFKQERSNDNNNNNNNEKDKGGDDTNFKKLKDSVAGYESKKKSKKKFWIPPKLAKQLKPLVKQYYQAWKNAGTDGLKGMKWGDFAKIEQIRQEIAKIVLTCPDIQIRAAFVEQLNALASQSCSSRTVQNFGGWFNSHVKK